MLKHTSKLEEAKARATFYHKKLTAINRIVDKQLVAQKSYAQKVKINDDSMVRFIAIFITIFYIFIGFTCSWVSIWAFSWLITK